MHAIDREAHGQVDRRRRLARAARLLLPVAVRLHRREARRATSTIRPRRRQLLAEAGFPNGFDIDFYAYRERHQTEAMISYLHAVGIKANLHFMQYAAMRDAVRANKAPLSHQTWGSFSVNDVSASTPAIFKFMVDDI